MRTTIQTQAAGKRLTLAELREFVDALREAPEETVIDGQVRMGGGVRVLTAVVDHGPSADGRN